MGCDLCGRDGARFQVRIEGTVMTVCAGCKGHGEMISQLPTAKEREVRAKRAAEKRAEEKRAEEKRAASSAPRSEVLLLVKNECGPVIKAARERLSLKQEELAKMLKIKESQLHIYETGSRKPDLGTARMLERALKIRLVEEHIETGMRGGTKEGRPVTIGDLLSRRVTPDTPRARTPPPRR